MILTLVHSTRLLPWGVKIMSVPRSDSRAIPRPARHQHPATKGHWNAEVAQGRGQMLADSCDPTPAAVQKVADNRLESLTTVAP